MKKILCLITAAAMMLTFAACGNENEPEEQTTDRTEINVEITDSVSADSTAPSENDSTTDSESEATELNEDESSTEEETTLDADPANWTDEQIIEFYKAAATKTAPNATSVQTMTMRELEVNDGDGLLGNLVDMITPFLVKALEKNSTEVQGITGGYSNLTVSDTTSVKAYKSGKYTVIEMTMKEQTDGIHGDALSGTVGHAITVVGDISVVEKELPQFDIGFEESNITLRYVYPKLKVKINENGIIESGEWSYRVLVNLENLRVDAKRIPLGATVKKGHGSVDYKIVLN